MYNPSICMERLRENPGQVPPKFELSTSQMLVIHIGTVLQYLDSLF
jgi:hypothetical protein